jgi:hypothetical protein
MLCVENILAENKLYDLWQVNQDAEYHEAGEAGATGLRAVPTRVPVPASVVAAPARVAVDAALHNRAGAADSRPAPVRK